MRRAVIQGLSDLVCSVATRLFVPPTTVPYSLIPDFKPPRRSFTTSRMFRPLPAKLPVFAAVGACAALVLLTALPAFAEFPALYNSESDTNYTLMPPAEAAAKLQLPPGFKTTLFAAEPDVQNPIAITWDARGRL